MIGESASRTGKDMRLVGQVGRVRQVGQVGRVGQVGGVKM